MGAATRTDVEHRQRTGNGLSIRGRLCGTGGFVLRFACLGSQFMSRFKMLLQGGIFKQ
jgi:hypothetical protein